MSKKAAMNTAFGPIALVAADQHDLHPVVRDEYAKRILPQSLGFFVGLGPARKLLFSFSDKQVPGISGWMLCRKRYTDDAAAKAVAAGAQAVVLLGAGMDTLAYRQPALSRAKVYEVDLPGNVDTKRKALVRIFGKVPEHVTLVPVDFDEPAPPGAEAKHTLLGEALAAAGWRTDQKTLFVWEGVTQYLTREGIDATLAFLATTAAGSLLAFTYVLADALSGENWYGAETALHKLVVKQGLFKTGFAPDEIPGLLAPYGWRVVEQVGATELAARYIAPTGRTLPLTGMERWVLAEKI